MYAPRAVVYHPTLDGPRAFLRKVWKTNRWGAVRRVRGGFRVQLRSATAFIPVLGVVLDRRRARRSPWRLQQSRLRASGLTVRWWEEVRALAVLYALVGYASSLARLCGWLEARSERRREDRAPLPQGSSTEAGRGAGST